MYYYVSGNRFDNKTICSLAEHVHIIRCNKTLNVVINGDISRYFDSSYNIIMANEQGQVDINIWKVRYFYLLYYTIMK
jgi:hypothetical protein